MTPDAMTELALIPLKWMWSHCTDRQTEAEADAEAEAEADAEAETIDDAARVLTIGSSESCQFGARRAELGSNDLLTQGMLSQIASQASRTVTCTPSEAVARKATTGLSAPLMTKHEQSKTRPSKTFGPAQIGSASLATDSLA